jgi:hypothetical protein
MADIYLIILLGEWSERNNLYVPLLMPTIIIAQEKTT